MYLVKIITNRDGDKPQIESNYCCQRYHVISSVKQPDRVYFDMEEPESHVTIDVTKARSQIFVTNINGKTIDTYRWSKDAKASD